MPKRLADSRDRLLSLAVRCGGRAQIGDCAPTICHTLPLSALLQLRG